MVAKTRPVKKPVKKTSAKKAAPKKVAAKPKTSKAVSAQDLEDQAAAFQENVGARIVTLQKSVRADEAKMAALETGIAEKKTELNGLLVLSRGFTGAPLATTGTAPSKAPAVAAATSAASTRPTLSTGSAASAAAPTSLHPLSGTVVFPPKSSVVAALGRKLVASRVKSKTTTTKP